MIRPLSEEQVEAWAALRSELWPACEREDSLADWADMQDGVDACGQPCTVLLALQEDRVVGFVEVTLRPYADGCETSPVGYVEGWFVCPEVRRQGFGQALLRAAEAWARGKGCREMASDTEAANQLSQDAHQALGYEVVETIVQFRKDL